MIPPEGGEYSFLMYLKSLELSGFKSFAKNTTLSFDTPITAIVGPNGSGKSNIAEAFRFVLGEQSIKSMRGKRTEDLIWNGGGDASRANRASVKVVFDNRQRILNIDFDEVALTRAIYRDSSSEYFVNGSQTRLKDIVELLAGAHIGSSGHHIISQGEADKILNANSKERRDMLEDALGLKIYQYKRQESERKLQKTAENLKSVESLRREIAPHLKFLGKQMEKIERTRSLKEELRKLYKEYFKREDFYIKRETSAVEALKAEPLRELKRLEGERQKQKEILASSSKRDEKTDRVIKLESDLSLRRAEKDTLVRELGRVEGAILSEERIIRREREASANEGNQTVPLHEVRDIGRILEEKIKELERSRDESAIPSFFNFIRRTFSDFVSRHKQSFGAPDIGQSEEELKRLKKEHEILSHKLNILNDEELLLKKRSSDLNAEISRVEDRSREAERAIFRIMSEENTARAVLASLRGREEKVSLLGEDLKRELSDGALLLGRDVLDFEKFPTVDSAGDSLNPEAPAREDRAGQEDRRRLLQRMKIRIEESGASGGEELRKEFKETSERDAFLSREVDDLTRSAESLKKLIRELEEKLDWEFREGVAKINGQFEHFFRLMFGGGEAKLRIVRETEKKRSDADLVLGDSPEERLAGEAEEITEGIEIEVSLPRKKIKGLMMLSGGERALTSIALLFAISQVNPPPFVVLDETDAALDEANSKKYGDMIENLAKLSQLILITHNRETMSHAGVLYGVTMGSGGVSKLLSIAFDEAVAVAK